ncbi:MAG: DUF4293 domain-containing protein, partial [Cyclobacteriaceae bacterium]|nr:DUF4293 domain-containing protein [Cyclobacteriaceae bacterium]
MWQRIQTIFLIIIAASMSLMLLFPIWAGQGEQGQVVFFPFYLRTPTEELFYPYYLIASMAIAVVTVAILEILKYKNRVLQVKLGAFNSLLMTATMVTALFIVKDLETEYKGGYGLALFMPVIAMV